MLIEPNMNLGALAEHMGRDVTCADALAVRDALIEQGYAGKDTGSIPEHEWLRIISDAAG